jgi:carotenoid cleavage dioxygenase-like enzyme
MDMENGDLPDSAHPRLYELTFDMATGAATSRKVSDVMCEFPRVDERLTGAPARPGSGARAAARGLRRCSLC